MSSKEAYINFLKSRGLIKPGGMDVSGVLHPEEMQKSLKQTRENRLKRFRESEKQMENLSDHLKESMKPLEKGEDPELRKKYSEAIMKRIKKVSPRT